MPSAPRKQSIFWTVPLYLRTTIAMVLCLTVVFAGLVATTTDAVRADKGAYVFEFVSRNAASLSIALSLEIEKLSAPTKCTDPASNETGNGVIQGRPQRRLDSPTINGLSRNPGPSETFFLRQGKNIVRVCYSDLLTNGGMEKVDGLNLEKRTLPIATLASIPGLLSRQTFVANSSATLLADPPNLNPKTSEIFKSIFNSYVASGKTNGTQVTNIDGQEYIVSFAEVSGTNVIIFSYQPLAIIEGQVGIIARHLYKVGAVLASIGLLLSLLFLHRLWRPLSQIRSFANALKMGQIPTPIRHVWRDEIRAIIDSLTDMFAAVRDRERELQALSAAQAHLVTYGRFLTRESSLDHIISSTKSHASAILQVSESELEVLPNFNFPGQNLSQLHKPEVSIQGKSCVAEVIESNVSYGTVSFNFAQLQPNLFHRTLIAGMANAIGTSLRALDLNTKATQAAVVGREIEGCQMIQESILRLEGAGDRYLLGYRYVPSAKIGGDWAGVYTDINGNCAAYLIDVTGHGIQSAFASSVVAGVINTLHARASSFPPLTEIIATLQQALARGVQSKLNLTFLALRFDHQSETVSVLNLCHPNPLLFSPSKGRVAIPMSNNEMITRVSIDQLQIQTVPFCDGDSLLLWTDGLVENALKIGKKLTTRWLNTQFQSICNEGSDPQAVAAAMFELTQRDIPQEEEKDDVCVLVIQAKQQGTLSLEPKLS